MAAASGSAASHTSVSAPSAGRPQQRPHHGDGTPGSDSAQARRVGPARVHRVDRHARSRQAPAPTRARGPPGPAWPGRRRASRRTAPCVHSRSSRSKRLRVHAPGRHRDDPGVGRSARSSGRRPPISANGPTTSDREGRLDAVRADRSFRVDRARVVDEDVEARLGREDLRRPPPRRTRASPCRRRRSGTGPRRVGATRSSRTRASRSSLRPTRTTRAPSAASASVAARPRPRGRSGDEHGPAARAHPAAGGLHPNSRRRTWKPTREKLPTTVTSSASSISDLRIHRHRPLRAQTGTRRMSRPRRWSHPTEHR